MRCGRAIGSTYCEEPPSRFYLVPVSLERSRAGFRCEAHQLQLAPDDAIREISYEEYLVWEILES